MFVSRTLSSSHVSFVWHNTFFKQFLTVPAMVLVGRWIAKRNIESVEIFFLIVVKLPRFPSHLEGSGIIAFYSLKHGSLSCKLS